MLRAWQQALNHVRLLINTRDPRSKQYLAALQEPNLTICYCKLQTDLHGLRLADYLQLEIQDFFESLNYPVDLLNYGTDNLDALTNKVDGPEDSIGGWLEPQTDLGHFAREVSLGLKSMQFEVCFSFSTNVLFHAPIKDIQAECLSTQPLLTIFSACMTRQGAW